MRAIGRRASVTGPNYTREKWGAEVDGNRRRGRGDERDIVNTLDLTLFACQTTAGLVSNLLSFTRSKSIERDAGSFSHLRLSLSLCLMAMASCSSLSAMDLSPASVQSLLPVRPLQQRFAPEQLTCNMSHQKKAKFFSYESKFTVRSSYSGDGGRPSSAGIFVGGFVLGGIIVGTLGCIYAPQISKALAGADRKDLMRKLPKFIYDEEKALEKTRKILTEKIAQLNSAIDEVSTQLRADDRTNGTAVVSDEIEAAI